MPLFTHPRPIPTMRQVHVWEQLVKAWGEDQERWHDVEYNLSEPRILWRAYWDRFNMIQIPVFPRDEFFQVAIEVAKEAKNKQDFKKLMGEKNKRQLAELEALLSDAARQTSDREEDFPCSDAFYRTLRACNNPYFIYLIRLLKGSASGWEADIWHEEPIDEAAVDPANDYEDPNMRSQAFDFWDEEYRGNMEPERHTPDEDFIPPQGTTNKLPSSAQGKQKRVQFNDDTIDFDEQQHQEPENSPSNPVLQASSVSQAANESTTKPNGVNEQGHKRRRLERSPAQASSSPQVSTETRKPEKRSRHDEDGNLSRKRQRLESPATQAPILHASSPSQATRSEVSKKRSRRDGDDDHSPKRQKLETFAAQTPASHVPSSPQSAVEQKMSKKRCQRDDGNNGSRKRQKRETSVTSDTATHHTADQPTANDNAAVGVGSGPRNKDSRQRGSQKRKTAPANTSRARTPSSGSPNTRSSRRNGSAAFWKLDDSGKAKLQ